MEIIEQDQPSVKEPAQIFDLTSGKMVDNPDAAPKESAKPDPKDAKKEAPKQPVIEEEEEEEEGSETEEQDESEEQEEEGSEEEEEEEGVQAKKKEEYETLSEDEYVAQTYGEKFGIKTQADLDKTVANAVDIMAELQAVKKERDTYKADSGKPKFTTPGQESAYNFVSQFDPKMQGEALQTFAKLIGMDMESADPTMLLEEKFIHDHPEWSRSESQRMFKKDYARKYTLSRDKFDGTDEEFAEEEKDREILKRGDVHLAKKSLKDLKEKHKPAEEQPKNNELVTKAIEQNAKKYTDHVQKAEEVTFGEGDDKFIFKLDAEKKSQLSEAMKAWVNNPNSYDDKGKLLGERDVEEMFHTLVGGMFIKEIVNAIKDQANSKVTIKRVDELSGKNPKKSKSQSHGEAKVNKDDMAEQARAIIRRRKAA